MHSKLKLAVQDNMAQNLTVSALGFLAAVFVILAVIGGLNSYSPVPFWDMWDGYLDFYGRISTGEYSAWWSQQNEHRIILARVFFWIDIELFNGQGWFLIVVNYTLITLTFLVFYIVLKAQLDSKDELPFLRILSFTILILLFSWIQENNLTWGFQSSFILAYLLPLTAFTLLHNSINPFRFQLACTAGILSAATMANGILALPLMTIYALIARMSKLRIATLGLLSALCIIAYFHDYHAIVGHGSFKDALLNHPVELMQYVLLYLGGPFYFMSYKNSYFIAGAASVFLISSSIYFAYHTLRHERGSSYQLSMLFVILYIGGTALGTGGGRLIFGLEQAFSSRYQTPALVAWSALLVLYAPLISRKIRNARRQYLYFSFLLVPVLLLPEQIHATRSQQNTLFHRHVAALALELGIDDRAEITTVYPYAEHAHSHAKYAIENDISVFGDKIIANVRQTIGKKLDNRSSEECVGHLETIGTIEGSSNYGRVSGWLIHKSENESPRRFHIIGPKERIVGYGLTGYLRSDVSDIYGDNVRESGFIGYILHQPAETPLIFRGYEPDCELKTVTPKKQ